MRQQLLDIELSPGYAWAGWVRHPGVEAANSRLALWLVHGGRLWLSSDTPAGKTHLVHVLAHEHPQLGFLRVQSDADQAAIRQVQCWLDELDHKAWWLVDVQADPVSRPTAIALFHLIERSREMQRHLAISWRIDDAGELPPELVSRMATLERVPMEAPSSDADLAQVLRTVAASRQWHVDDAVIRLMLTYLPRDLDGLISAMGQMERASLAERKRLTARWASPKIRGLSEARQSNLFSEG